LIPESPGLNPSWKNATHGLQNFSSRWHSPALPMALTVEFHKLGPAAEYKQVKFTPTMHTELLITGK